LYVNTTSCLMDTHLKSWRAGKEPKL